jgi:acyl-CoA thioesterase II
MTDLLASLDLLETAPDVFLGHAPQTYWQRIFGGQVIAQALRATMRTIEGRLPHSLHASFLLPGDPSVPVCYAVERLRDGKSFSTRRLLARQKDNPIFTMTASFHAIESGLDHQVSMPDVPFPEDLPDESAIRQEAFAFIPDPVRAYLTKERPIELRPVEYARYASRDPAEPKFHVWIRAAHTLPDDLALHQSLLAYASDLTLLDSALIAHGRSLFEPAIQAASLDHALWFHRPFRMDQWLLYAQDSPSTHAARGFSRGMIFTRDGHLVASVAQEGLIRLRTSSYKAVAV